MPIGSSLIHMINLILLILLILPILPLIRLINSIKKIKLVNNNAKSAIRFYLWWNMAFPSYLHCKKKSYR